MRRAGAALLRGGVAGRWLWRAGRRRRPVPAGVAGLAGGALPVPAGGAAALVVRDARRARAPGSWWARSGMRTGATRPAVWSSADGAAWRSLRPEPITYYGEQNVLSAVACRATAGRRRWARRRAGCTAIRGRVRGCRRATACWHEVAAHVRVVRWSADAVNVAPVGGGSGGLSDLGQPGERRGGVGVAGRGEVSRCVEGCRRWRRTMRGRRGRSSGGRRRRRLAGGRRRAPAGRTDRDALGWRSADGAVWSRVPAEGGSAGLRGDSAGGRARAAYRVGVGVSGSAFGVWRLDGGRWRPAGSFGVLRQAGVSAVRSLAVVGDRLFCVTSDGAAYAVWVSSDGGASWAEVALPAGPVAGPESSMTVAGVGSRVVLVVDDGVGARLFSAG